MAITTVKSRRRPPKASWNFEEGAPIAEGRTVLKPLGGGSRYEVFLVRARRGAASQPAQGPGRPADGGGAGHGP